MLITNSIKLKIKLKNFTLYRIYFKIRSLDEEAPGIPFKRRQVSKTGLPVPAECRIPGIPKTRRLRLRGG